MHHNAGEHTPATTQDERADGNKAAMRTPSRASVEQKQSASPTLGQRTPLGVEAVLHVALVRLQLAHQRLDEIGLCARHTSQKQT